MTRQDAASAWGWTASFIYLSGFLYAVGVEPLWSLAAGFVCTVLTAWRTRDLPPVSASQLAKITTLGVAGLSLSLLVDAHASHVNLLDRAQWPDLMKSGAFGFVGTAAIACFLISFISANAVRIVMLRTLR